MAVKFANLASTTLSSAITNSATSIAVADASLFPTLGSGDYFYATIGEGSGSEIVKVTAISSNTLTVTRAQDGTTASAFSSGETIALRVVAAALDDIASQAQSAADTESVSIDGDTMTGSLSISGNGLQLDFYGGNNRIRFNGYRALEGSTNGGILQVGEGYGVVQSYGHLNLTSGHDYQVNGITVIDSSRNATLNSRLTFSYNSHYFETGTNSISFKNSGGTSYFTINNTGISTTGTISSGAITSSGNVHLTNGNVTIGDLANTNSGSLYLRGTIANKEARLFCTNGNLHMDSASGNAMYLNYYNGNGIYFGNGATGTNANIAANGNFTTSGTISSGAVTSSGDIDAAGDIYTGSSNSRFKENQLRFNASGASYIDQATTGQTLYFRTSNNSSLDTTWLEANSAGQATFGGNVIVEGNLTVSGTTTTIDTANLNVEDNNITLNYSTGDSSATANGAGITIQDAVNSTTDATILWDSTYDEFGFSHPISVVGNSTFTGSSNDSSMAAAFRNSDGTIILRVRNDGQVLIPSGYLFAQHSSGIYSTGSIKARGGITNDGGNNLSISSGGTDITFNSKNFTSVGTISSGAITARGDSGSDSIVRIRNTNSTSKITRLQFEDSSGTVGDGLIAYDHSDASSANHYLGMGVNNNTAFKIDNNDNATFTGAISSGAITATGLTTLGRTASDRGDISDTNTALIATSRGVTHTDSQTNVLRLQRDGTSGVVYAGLADIDLERWESSGVFSRTAMHFKLGHGNLSPVSDANIPTVMTLRSSGMVGIGSTAPSKPLHVKTSLNEGIFLEGTSNGVWMDVQSSLSELWSMGADSNGWAIYNRTDSAYRLRVENGGDVDIVSGGLKVGATTVIDSSRNVYANQYYYAASKIVAQATDSYLRINQSNQFGSGIWIGSSRLLSGTSYIATGSNGSATTSRVYMYGGTYDGTNVIALDGTDGKIKGSYYAVGGTTVIDSSRNLTNIGTISSGAITSSATSTFSGGLDTNNSQLRVKISPWTGTTYGYGMKSGMTFGGLSNNYALTFQMNSSAGRGFWWGQDTHTDAQGAMALTNDGKLTVSHSLRLGYGISDTTTPGATYALDVSGSISSGAITSSGTGTFDELTLTGGSDNLTFTEVSGDWSILNAQQSNGLVIYDGTSGVTVLYNNAEVGQFNNSGFDVVSGALHVGGTPRISAGGTATFTGVDIINSGMPTLTLYDNGNGGGGAAEAKIEFTNTAGTAIAIGYTDDQAGDSDLIISTNAAGTYGGYLGLTAAAINDAQSDIILEPKTDVRIATGGLKVGTTTVIDSSRNLSNIGTISSGAITTTGDISLNKADGFVYLNNVGTGNSGIYVRGITSSNTLRSHTTDNFRWEVLGSQKMELNSSGVLNVVGGYQVNGTTRINSVGDGLFTSLYIGSTNIVDTSRNLTNIGGIGLSGNITFGNNTTSGRYDIVVGSQTTARGMLFAPYTTFGTRFSGWDAWIGQNTRTAVGTTSSGIELASSYTAGGASALNIGFFGLNFYTWSSSQLSGLSQGSALSLGTPKFSITGAGDLQLGGTTVIDSSRNVFAQDISVGANGTITRSNHHSGHLEGSYNNVGNNNSKSNPIYTIGSAYNPTDAALGSMYGIGFTKKGDATFLSGFRQSGWGLYVASDGNARVWLNAQTGVVASTAGYDVGNVNVIDSSRNLTNIGTISSGKITASGSGTASSPVVAITSSNSSAFIHASNAFAANMTAGQFHGHFFGNAGSTKNAGAIGYYWAASGSDSNFVSIGHWGADHLLRLYGNGDLNIHNGGLQIGGTSVISSSRVLQNVSVADGVDVARDKTNIGAVDANNLDKQGFYGNSSESSNQPFDNNAGTIVHMRGRDNNYKSQLFSYSDSGELWIRGLHGSGASWSSWSKVFHDGYHPNADKWTTARTLSLTGDATGSVSWDGSANASITVAVGDADTVDSLHASSFIRSDADDNVTGHTEWQDGYNIRMGNGADLRIWHDGSNHYFRNYLHAGGNFYFQGEDSNGSNRALIYMITNSSAPYVQLFHVGNEKLRTVSEGINVYGDLTATGNVTAYSDIRKKTNIKPLEGGLDIVKALEPKRFDWIESGEGSLGFIAQEVEEYLPELVETKVEDIVEIDEEQNPIVVGEEEVKSLDYGKMVSVLWAAVKEQSAQIETLNKRIEELENGNN